MVAVLKTHGQLLLFSRTSMNVMLESSLIKSFGISVHGECDFSGQSNLRVCGRSEFFHDTHRRIFTKVLVPLSNNIFDEFRILQTKKQNNHIPKVKDLVG